MTFRGVQQNIGCGTGGQRRVVWPGRVLTGALLVLGQSTAAHAYRTGSDLEELAASPVPIRFASDEVRLELFGKVPESVSLDKVKVAIESATETWGRPGCTTFRALLVGSSQIEAQRGDGLNTIQWVDDWEERGFSADGAGVTDVQYGGLVDGSWQVLEADIYLNSAMSWTTHGDVEGLRDVQAVLTHELGHLAGLLHPCELEATEGARACKESELTSSAMAPGYASSQVALTPDDVDGICFLYPDPDCRDSSCAEEGETELPPFEMAEGGASGVEPGASDPRLRSLGDPCEEPGDCPGGQCLTTDGGQAQCTRTCGGDALACPAGWECSRLGAEQVCTPQWQEGGCNVAPLGHLYSCPTSHAALGLMLLFVGRRIANRRSIGPGKLWK